MENFEKTYRRLKTGLERAYVEWKTPVFDGMDRQESRDLFYEAIEEELWKARRLHEMENENGVKVVLRRVAGTLPTVKLKTPRRK